MQERQTALKSFADVVAEERRSINRRRSGRRKTLQAPAEDATDPSHPRPDPCDAVGVALSGGGIRSAAFCLGVLQALSTHKLVDKIDYLSTVSGGGYIGCCLASCWHAAKKFPFAENAEIRDSPAVGHLRNYSNYLLPRGRSTVRDWSEAGAVILRGLMANVALILVTLLFCALVTRIAFPLRADLTAGSFLLRLVERAVAPAGIDWANRLFGAAHVPFALTIVLAIVLMLWLLAWAVWRSMPNSRGSDVSGLWLSVAQGLLIATCVSAFLDLQPILIEALARAHEH